MTTIVARRKGTEAWKWFVTKRGALALEPTWMTESAARTLLASVARTNRDYEFALADRKEARR